MNTSARSYKTISNEDLQRLGDIARRDRNDFFQRLPRYHVLADRIIAVALCQGAALHYVDGKNGIKDFDVWTFYARHSAVTFPQRRYKEQDFGDPKFGQSPDKPDYKGRRVDLLGRSLNVEPGTDPVKVIQAYLSEPKTQTATLLAKKAVVIIEPDELLGFVAWKP